VVELTRLLDRSGLEPQNLGSYLRSYQLREIGIKELKNTASRVIEEVEAGERVVVTRRGRPTALILSMEDAEDFVLAYAEEFVEMRQRGRREYAEGKSVPLDEI
jgi:prevent-host-death family protein